MTKEEYIEFKNNIFKNEKKIYTNSVKFGPKTLIETLDEKKFEKYYY